MTHLRYWRHSKELNNAKCSMLAFYEDCVKIWEMSIGVLVSHPSHVRWARHRWPDAILIAKEMIIIQTFPEEEIEYFYPACSSNGELELFVADFSENWYRDKDGVDITFFEGISLPQVLTGSIILGVAGCLREDAAIRYWENRLDCLWVSNLENSLLKNALSEIDTTCNYYEPPNIFSNITNPNPERVLRDYLAIEHTWAKTFVINLIKFLQWILFPGSRKDCHLVFSDSVNHSTELRDHCLWTNQIDPRKSAYIVADKRDILASDALFKKLDLEFINDSWVNTISNKYRSAIDDRAARFIYRYLISVITSNKSIISRYYAQILGLFKTYSIKSLQVPSELFEPYLVAIQYAAYRGLPKILLIDGHDVVGMGFPKLKSSTNRDLLIDQVGVKSELLLSYGKYKGFIDSQMIKVGSQSLQLRQQNSFLAREFDAIIMTWVPNDKNPHARLDSPSKTLEEAIQVVSQICSGKIAIKVKADVEIDYVIQVLQNLKMQDHVAILSGRFLDHVGKARLIVGGISSAVAESMLSGVPYIIFEPVENGYSDIHFQDDFLLHRNRIARTKSELETLLSSGKSSIDANPSEYLYFNR